MNITIAGVKEVAEYVGKYADIDVEFGNTLMTVRADSSKTINEFESRVVAGTLDWDGEEVNGVIFLNELVNFTDTRAELKQTGPDHWVARYTGLTFTDQD